MLRFVSSYHFHSLCGVLMATTRNLRRSLYLPMRHAGLAISLLSASIANAGLAHAQHFRISEEIISDPMTGAAMLGYDPVLYFLEGRATLGSSNVQAHFAGKIWHFKSIANKAAFETQPDIYVPGFGGHDPVAVASGFALAGSPDIYTIHEGRIYLFRRPENRDLFVARPEMLDEAHRIWAEVKRNLSP